MHRELLLIGQTFPLCLNVSDRDRSLLGRRRRGGRGVAAREFGMVRGRCCEASTVHGGPEGCDR